MGKWTYRVFKQIYKYTFENEEIIEEIFSIREYYENPYGWSAEPDSVVSTDGIEGLRWQLTEMLKALDKPVVDI